ncbi:SpoIIE family protein phosphatase [Kitasatospora sp. NPDC091335]|uniref:SpoIIE family protein phosphatase n=1 Tax=Kitasatospora sp. NPDC091335 TaxID=3364085 RepID=UPI0038075CCA
MTTITIGIARREGTAGPIADAAATYTSDATGRTAAALVDGMGHADDIVRLAPMLAETAARVGAGRGALAGLLSAGLLLADPGHPDAVGVLAVTRADGSGAELVWAGDCRAYRWDGTELAQLTTDHNLAAYLSRAALAAGEVPVSALADSVGVTLGRATPATAPYVGVPAGGLLVLTTDGVHDQVPAERVEALVREHQGLDPQALADALVAAATADSGGYRDDATAVVLPLGLAHSAPALTPTMAMHLGRLATGASGLTPDVRARVHAAIEVAMHDGTEAGVCALVDILMAETARATGPGR